MSRGVGWDLWKKKFAPIDTRVTSLEETYVKAYWFESIASGTTGTITAPVTGATFVLNEWSAGVDALASTISSGVPTYVSPVTAGGTPITVTFDSAGAYVLSGTPSAYPVAVIFVYRCQFQYFDDTLSLFETELDPQHNSILGLQGGTTDEYYHLTSAEETAATRDATNVQNGLMPTGKLDGWDAAASASHAEAHDVASHSDVVDVTGANLEELTGGGDTTLHDHDGITENTNARHDASHNAASHSDLTSSGTVIEAAVSASHSNAADHTQGTDTALGAQTENLDMNTHKIVGVTDPTTNQEAATKKYVDDNAGGSVATDSIWDAAGDLVYGTGADTAAKLIAGNADLKMFMNAAGSAPEWSSGIKIGNFTYNTATASGTHAVSGIGFKPSNVFFLVTVNDTSEISLGFDNMSAPYSVYYGFEGNAVWRHTNTAIMLYQASGIYYTGAITTFGTDGFTITWAKGGAKTGTARVIYLAFR